VRALLTSSPHAAAAAIPLEAGRAEVLVNPSFEAAAESPSREELERRLADLSAHYEVARALLGASEHRVVASRVIHSGMGLLGAGSGALLMFDGRDRFRLLQSTQSGIAEFGVRLPESARDWICEQRVFTLAGAACARALGDARDALTATLDASVGAAVTDASGLRALLVFGPRLLGDDYGEPERLELEAIAGLAALALRIPAAAHEARGTAETRVAKSHAFEALRERHPALREMVGESIATFETAQDLVAAAGTHFSVLLTGESGVGKEVAARALHRMSERAEGPFEIVDCGSIPRELIESELFGHVRGSFTGAHKDRRGAFEMAHRGTLFLDEIGDMPLQLQTRLLRVLQEGRIRRVGDENAIDVDVRVIAATHRDLKAAVIEKRFREDLFYRLNVFAIHIAPLRERLDDLRVLAMHFLKAHGRELGVSEWTIDDEVMAALERHRFPGNLRELGNVCAGLAVSAREDGRVELEDLRRVWRRQHAGEPMPGEESGALGAGAAGGALGAWVLEQVRRARFNLIAAARELQRRKRAGHATPLTERSALAYYLSGEILRALIESAGDEDAAARSLAADPELVPRVAQRVSRACDALRSANGDLPSLRRAFGKLPAEYQPLLAEATRVVTRV
jgi:transcriptional regulator with GAF, ATPase, and Fis domain